MPSCARRIGLVEGPVHRLRRSIRRMQLSHGLTRGSVTFPDPNLVSCGGLVPVLALAGRVGRRPDGTRGWPTRCAPRAPSRHHQEPAHAGPLSLSRSPAPPMSSSSPPPSRGSSVKHVRCGFPRATESSQQAVPASSLIAEDTRACPWTPPGWVRLRDRTNCVALFDR
jgi:hypothetical protein